MIEEREGGCSVLSGTSKAGCEEEHLWDQNVEGNWEVWMGAPMDGGYFF